MYQLPLFLKPAGFQPKKQISSPQPLHPTTSPNHLDLLLGRIGQGVLREQLINSAMKTLSTGTIITQDVDHQGVVEQTWRSRQVGRGGYSQVTRNVVNLATPPLTYEDDISFQKYGWL